MAIYSFKFGKDLETLKEVVGKYIALVFLRTQGFDIIHPPLKPAKHFLDFLTAPEAVVEKGGRRYVLRIEYGKGAELDAEEREMLLRLRKTGCEPVFVRVWGSIERDEWQVEWIPASKLD